MDNTMLNNITLSKEDLLEIVVSLDNEACRDHTRAEALRNLKWKVFALMVKAEKEAA